MRKKSVILVSIATFVIIGFSSTGCEDPKIKPEEAQPFVDTWSQKVGPALIEQASSAATSEALKARLQQARADASGTSGPTYDIRVEEVYSGRKYKAGFLKQGKLNDNGKAVLAALRKVHEDGFDPKHYQIDKVDEKLKELEALSKEYAELGGISLGDAEKKFALDYITQKTAKEFAFDKAGEKTLTDQLFEVEAGKALLEKKKRYEEVGAKMADLEAHIEFILARGLVRYAFRLKHHRLPDLFVHKRHDDRYNDPETRGKRPDKVKATYRGGSVWRRATFVARAVGKTRKKEILYKKLENTLVEALDKDAKKVVTKLSPGPQYEKLKKEYLRYKKIVDGGGWEQVPQQRGLRRGKKSPTVQKLKVRLQKEGYMPEKMIADNLYDQALTDALIAYQKTHQFKPDGKLTRGLWRSLNVSAKRRLKQIKMNMKRWRHGNIRHHDDKLYVLVNIPGFHAEIWKDQKREMRMRVVVGNNDQEKDEETNEKIHPNRTPTLSAFIDRVIYNPYWNVTPRIREDEILVDVRKDLEPRYKAKMLKNLGIDPNKTATVTPPATPPTNTTLNPTTPPVVAANKTPNLFRKTKEGVVFDIASYKSLYQAKHGSEPDVKAQFPYLSMETGIIDVSTTDPANIPPWYAKEGYEVMHAGKKWEFVRQLNGDKNALGRVKVIFPNLHDVYLHDTQQKGLFAKEVRAYSHGCMRMHKPLDFSQWLLENDGQWDKAFIKRILSKKQYEPIFLKTKVPVHVVYHSVRVDDNGRANFLADVYRKDAEGKM